MTPARAEGVRQARRPVADRELSVRRDTIDVEGDVRSPTSRHRASRPRPRPGTRSAQHELAGSWSTSPGAHRSTRSCGSTVSVGSHPATLVFLGCASPVWNAQSSIEASIGRDETLLAQIGTSESQEGRLVLRIELRSPPLG